MSTAPPSFPRLCAPILLALCTAPTLGAQITAVAAPAEAQAFGPAELQALVEHAFEVFDPIGLAVAVVDGGELVFEFGVGERRKGSGEAVTPQTLFNIASCTKAFTAACVGKLISAGRIRWDDPVVRHLPEFRLEDPWITRHLTVRDLLCHRSGLSTFEGDLLWYGSELDDAEVLRRMERLPICRRFREQFGYQNLMYLVAGMLIERVSGQSWPDFLRAELLDPLGMDGSASTRAELPADAEVASPHLDGRPIAPYDFRAAKAAGAMWSSVDELARWIRMLVAGGRFEDRQVLDEDVLQACWRPCVSLAGGRVPAAIEDFSSYGLGWFLSVHEGEKLVEHDGGMPGFLSKVTLLPAEGFGLAILNNGADGLLNLALRRAILAQREGHDGHVILDELAATAARRRAAATAATERRIAARQMGTSPSLPLTGFAGRFEDRLLGPAVMRCDDAGLQLVIEASPATLHGTLSHWHHDVFRVDFADPLLPFALVRFSLDTQGAVDGFRIDCPIDDFDFASLDFRVQR